MGRPDNRLRGLVPKMREAERGPSSRSCRGSTTSTAIRQMRAELRDVPPRRVRLPRRLLRRRAARCALPVHQGPRQPRHRRRPARGVAAARRICSPTCSRASRRRRSSTASHAVAVDQRQHPEEAAAARAASSHGCEAFRVYRFRDGAWSEIILGAVMGAARRVEVTKRHRRIEDQLARTFGTAPAPASQRAPSQWPSAPEVDPTRNFEPIHAQQPPPGYRRPMPAPPVQPAATQWPHQRQNPGISRCLIRAITRGARIRPPAPRANLSSIKPSGLPSGRMARNR